MQPSLCSGSKNICINFALLNLQIRHFQIPILQFSLCSNYAKSFVFLRFAQEPNISAQLAMLAVLIRYFFGSTFTGRRTLFTCGFYRQMDKEIYITQDHTQDHSFMLPFGKNLKSTEKSHRIYDSKLALTTMNRCKTKLVCSWDLHRICVFAFHFLMAITLHCRFLVPGNTQKISYRDLTPFLA